MKNILMFFLCIPQLLFSQNENKPTCVKLAGNENCCDMSGLKRLTSTDTTIIWETFEDKDIIKSLKSDYEYFTEHLRSQTSQSNILSSYKYVTLSAIKFKQDSLKDRYVKIYEIRFNKSTELAEDLIKIKDSRIETIDWPDASVPVRFYAKNNSLFVILNVSDDLTAYENDNAFKLWFNQLADMLIKKIDDL